jgi:molybdate transport system substrate-binding protein
VSYEEDVRAVLNKVALGEADAGIVYESDARADAAARVGTLDIPEELNTVAQYPITPLKDSQNAALAQKFIAYVLSPEAQAVLEKHGFTAAVGNR